MYNLNELLFEIALEKAKQENDSNPFEKGLVDAISYEYNRQQYNDCLRHINDENRQIEAIYNNISFKGFATPYEQLELQRHFLMRREYEAKSMKHFMSGCQDASDVLK